MMGGAAVSSALSVPLADRFGSWQASLGSWSVVALVASSRGRRRARTGASPSQFSR